MSDCRASASMMPRGSDRAMPDTPIVTDRRKPPKRSDRTDWIDSDSRFSASRAASPASVSQKSSVTMIATMTEAAGSTRSIAR